MKKSEKYIRKFIYWRPVRSFLHYSRLVVLPGFQGVPLFDVMVFFFSGLSKGFLNQRAAALSFNFFLSLFPLLIFFVTLIPYIPIDDLYLQVYIFLQEFIPASAYGAVERTIDGIFRQKHQGLMSIGFVTSVFVASNGINAMLESFSSTLHVIQKRHWLKQRIFSISTVFGIGIVVIGSFALVIGYQYVIDYLIHATGFISAIFGFIRWSILISLVYFMFASLYYYAPMDRTNFKFLSAGATLATILFILTTFGFNFYIERFSSYNALYGSIGALIIFLLWIYLNSYILLIGFELNASIAHALTQGHRKKQFDLYGEEKLYISRTASNRSIYRRWNKILKSFRIFARNNK